MDILEKIRGVILAGGEGKRLRPLSYYLQKCMIPIGNKQKPLIEHIIRLLRHHGIIDITLLLGYKHEQIENYFDDGNRFDVNLTYLEDDPSMKGTGNALLNLYRKGYLSSKDPILIYYGDILSNINIKEMLILHEKTRATATLALAQSYNVPVGVADVKGNKVVGWAEKPNINLTVGIGIFVLEAKVLNELSYLTERKKELDITRDIIPHIIEKGDNVTAYITDSYWYDVGSIEKYEKLDNNIIEKQFSFLYEPNLPPLIQSRGYSSQLKRFEVKNWNTIKI